MTVYTLTVWHARPGSEKAFIDAWTALANESGHAGFDAPGTLVRDQACATRFVSFGPWVDEEEVERFRRHARLVGLLQPVLDAVESSDPGLFDLVVQTP